MTKQEALQELMDLIDRLRTYASTRKGELAELITEAADALERQTCDDAVSRAAAIDICNYAADLWHGLLGEGIVIAVRERIEQLPAVQQEPKPDENGSEPFGNAEMMGDRTTDECISRQAAINALMKRDKELRNINWYDKPFSESECKGIDYALEIVNALPSVQPTQSNASNALKTLDCIDRQVAIKTLEKGLPSEPLKSKYTEGITVGFGLAITWIEQLPAVQPQPEEDCDTCKHGYFGDRQCDNCRVRYLSHYEREEERRTDEQTD